MKKILYGKMLIEIDNTVTMDDGVTLRYDVYRPNDNDNDNGKYPATYGPYSKGMHFPKVMAYFGRE